MSNEHLQVPINTTVDKYLGNPIKPDKASFDFLIEKTSAKLQVWKAKLLTQAGRLVLIKAVLQAMPVYYMSTTVIPVSVMKALNALIRRFFWGFGDKARYLAYIAWDTICMPKGIGGGLGVRDLKVVNEALIMKSLWKLLTNSPTPWVQLVLAKYLPMSNVWSSKRVYNCTILWRASMNAREAMLGMIQWKLGDGLKCAVFGDPWFPGVISHQPADPLHKNLKISDLVDHNNGTWDTHLLNQLFGMHIGELIASTVLPPTQQAGEDKLIFTPSNSGMFEVKHAYKQLRGTVETTPNDSTPLWKLIWKEGNAVPRVRLFVWRLLENGLPLSKTIANRTSKGDPFCATCRQGEEDPIHMMVYCPFAKACWFVGPLAIRIEHLNTAGSLISVFLNLADVIQKDDWTLVMNTCWAIWRSRNDKACGGKPPTFSQFNKYLQLMNSKASIALSGTIPKHIQQSRQRDDSQNPLFTCQIYGSWIKEWRGGLGFILCKGQELCAAVSRGIQACCPIQAEAIALMEAVAYVSQKGISECQFYTDNETLADLTCALQPPLKANWRAFREIFEVWKRFKENPGFNCKFFARSHNGMADFLARRGSKEHWDFETYTYPILLFDV